jgi:Fe-S cluster biosynthesis and repair protein YggX
MINLNSIPAPIPTVASRILEGEAVLVHPGQGKVKVLNELGAEIWQRLDGKRTLLEIVEALFKRYHVDRTVLEQDVIRFVQGLHERDLVSIEEPADSP